MDRARNETRRREIEEELDCPDLPAGGAYLFDIYTRLRSRKGSDGMGNVLPIEWPDLDAFNRLTRLNLKPWEVELIERLDEVYITERAKILAD